jgi:hypothetical protein
MSRLSRHVLRRDKSYQLMVSLEEDERAVLNIMDCMTTILKDIPPDKIPTKTRKKIPAIWQTICIMARIASIEGHWEIPVQPVQHYMPHQNALNNIVEKWKTLAEKENAQAMEFINLLKEPAV